MIDFPPELEVPWLYLQRHFGCAADAGNITSNAVHNFDERGDQVYRINVGMPSVIQSSENTFIRIFHDVEVLVSKKTLFLLTPTLHIQVSKGA